MNDETRVYTWSLFTRIMLFVVFAPLALGSVAVTVGAVILVAAAVAGGESFEPGMLLVAPILLGGMTMFVPAAVYSLMAGRLEFKQDRVLLPRLVVTPMVLLGPIELAYDDIDAWGVGFTYARYMGMVPFVLIRDRSGTQHSLPLANYSGNDTAEILRLLEQCSGKAPVKAEQGFFSSYLVEG